MSLAIPTSGVKTGGNTLGGWPFMSNESLSRELPHLNRESRRWRSYPDLFGHGPLVKLVSVMYGAKGESSPPSRTGLLLRCFDSILG